jgi:hypothetical protein
VRHGRHDLATPAGWQVRKDEVDQGTADVRKGIPVEEEEGCAAVAPPQKLYRIVEGEDFALLATPFVFDRCITLRILAVLRASS